MLSIFAQRLGTGIKSSINVVQKRNFLLGKKVGEKKYRLKDKMDDVWTLIYRAPMEYYLATCNYVTTLSAVLLTGFAIVQFNDRGKIPDKELKPFELIKGRVLMAESDYKYFASAFVAFNLMLRIFVHRYPLRIYRNGLNYTAIFEGQFPLKKDKLEFIKGAVKDLPQTGILPWKDCRFKINDQRHVIMLYESFRTPSELFEMMKKPMKPKKYIEHD